MLAVEAVLHHQLAQSQAHRQVLARVADRRVRMHTALKF